MPEDFEGNKLSLGDSIIYITGSYRDFSTGMILKFGKQKATLLIKGTRTTVRYCKQLMKARRQV